MICSFSFILSLFALLRSISSNSIQKPTNIQCVRELEWTIFKPETCAFKYLEKLAKTFQLRGQAIFSPLVDQYIYTFEAATKVNVILVNAFGQQTFYYPNGTKTFGISAQFANSAQAYTNFPGFVRQINMQNFYYTFQMFSKDGRYYAVTLYMPLSNDPIFC